MKVLVIPDSHLHTEVIARGLALAKKVRADRVVVLGDYLDDWGAIDEDYYTMIDYLKGILRSNPNVEMLLGNHELSYFGFPCGGHNRRVAKAMRDSLLPDRRFYFAVAHDGVLYSHAGVCLAWLKENNLITQNDLRFKLPKNQGADLLEKLVNGVSNFDVFNKVGRAREGKNAPSPLWADLTELIADVLPVKQVVGHTPVKQIENVGRCWFTDVFSNGNESDEYLIVTDGKPDVIHYGDYFDE